MNEKEISKTLKYNIIIIINMAIEYKLQHS